MLVTNVSGKPGLVDEEDAVLVVIDVEEKLYRVMAHKERLVSNITKLIKVCRLLGIPILLTEQYPEGLGVTIEEVRRELGGCYKPVRKTSFSCFGEDSFVRRLGETGRKTLLLTGIELHVCVAQTALEAVELGYRPIVVLDATSSRSVEEYEMGVRRLIARGVDVASTEALIFELLRDASRPEFKSVLSLIKGGSSRNPSADLR